MTAPDMTTPPVDATETDAAETVDTTETDAAPASKANREAARYRTQLREVEAERDRLAETVKTLRTQAAEAALGDVLAKPSALWMAGHDVTDFYGDSGELDVARLHEAARQAITEQGIAPYRRFKGGADGGARGNSGTKASPTWADALRGNR